MSDANNQHEVTPALRNVALGVLVLVDAIAVAITSMRSPGRDSDDLWNVELWGAWRPFSSRVALPQDTFILHAPVNLLSRFVFGEGVTSLTVTAVLLNVIGFILVLRFLGFVAERAAITPTRTLYLQVGVGLLYALVSTDFIAFVARPNYRNIEIGLFLVATQLLITTAERQHLRVSNVILVSLVLGLFAYNDPMFLYCGLASWLAVVCVRWTFSKNSSVESRSAIMLLGGMVAFALFRVTLRTAGLEISPKYAQSHFANLVDLPRTSSQSVEHVLISVGASFSNREFASPETFSRLLRLALVVLIIVGAWVYRKRVPVPARLPLLAVIVPIGAIFTANTLSTIGSNALQNSRYLVPAVGLMMVLAIIPVAFGSDRVRGVLGALILVIAAVASMNLLRFGRGLVAEGVDTSGFDAMETLAHQLEGDGAQIGYGTFWEAMPISYFADDGLVMTSVACAINGAPELTGFDNLEVPGVVTDQSFYLLGAPSGGACSRDQVLAAFGPPVKETQYDLGGGLVVTALWYDGNVGADLVPTE